MYWNGDDYDAMAKLAIDIYVDYNITSFPVKEADVCRKLGLKLIPYSSYSEDGQKQLIKRSSDGFYAPPTLISPPSIFFNDSTKSYQRQRYTIFHEVKHYVNNDTCDSEYNNDMAEYFSKYFMCPIPYLIKTNVDDELTIIANHDVSEEVARYVLKNIHNRRARYGNKIFEYELPLIDLLCPELI